MNVENLEFAYLVLNLEVHKLRVQKDTTTTKIVYYIGFPFSQKYYISNCILDDKVFVNLEDAIAFCKSIIEKKEASALRRLERIRDYKRRLDAAPSQYMRPGINF